MTSKRKIESIIGLFVIVLSILFVIYIFDAVYKKSSDYYTINADFNEVGELSRGNSVILKGVKVGYVEKVSLDMHNHKVKVSMKVDSSVKLPLDTQASIIDTSFFSNRAINLTLGHLHSYAYNNFTLKKTKDYTYIESLLSNFLFH